MKYLVTGLGNIGAEYDQTRHNIGFEVVDYLAEKFEVKFEEERYGKVARIKHKGRILVLLKPNTYMNLSGQAVRYWLQKEKIGVDKLQVILDDLNLDFGRLRIKSKGGAGGHNGLKDIEARLSTVKYTRLKVGIGSKYQKGQQANFVLGRWNLHEQKYLEKIIAHTADAILSFTTIGMERTMNQYNKQIVKIEPPQEVEKKKPLPPIIDL